MKKAYKKIVLFLFIGIIFFLGVKEEIHAATIPASISSGSVIIGDEIKVTVTCPDNHLATVTITYDSSMLEYVSGGTLQSEGTIGINLGSQGVQKGTFRFKTKKVGKATIKVNPDVVTDAATWEEKKYSAKSLSVTIEKEPEPVVVLSSNNKLKSLVLKAGDEAIELSPEFSSKVKDYEAQVVYSVEELKVYTELSDGSAYVDSITGNKNFQVGDNYVTVKVVAENGDVRTYSIRVKRLRENQEVGAPEVDEDDAKFSYKEGTYVSVKEGIPDVNVPAMFSASVIMIEEKQYPCLINKDTGLVLMFLCPEGKKDGTLYFYDSSTKVVEPFVFLEHGDKYVVVLPTCEISEVPVGYEATELEIPDKGLVTAYVKNTSSTRDASTNNEFCLLYCINSDAQRGWYQYDLSEGTYQRYNVETTERLPDQNTEVETETQVNGSEIMPGTVVSGNNQLSKLLFYLLIGAVVIIFILGILIIIVMRMHRDTSEDEENLEDEEENEAEEETEEVEEETEEVEEETEEVEEETEEVEEEIEEVEEETEEVEEEIEEVEEETEKIEEETEEMEEETEEVEEETEEIEEELEEVEENEEIEEVEDDEKVEIVEEDDYKKGYVDEFEENVTESEKEDGDFEFIDL